MLPRSPELALRVETEIAQEQLRHNPHLRVVVDQEHESRARPPSTVATHDALHRRLAQAAAGALLGDVAILTVVDDDGHIREGDASRWRRPVTG